MLKFLLYRQWNIACTCKTRVAGWVQGEGDHIGNYVWDSSCQRVVTISNGHSFMSKFMKGRGNSN